MTFTPTDYLPYDFANRRHIGPSPAEMAEMLKVVGAKDLDALIDDASLVVLSQDWHPSDHTSFAQNHDGKTPFMEIEMPYGPQTLWPNHCVQGTAGAEFHKRLNTDRADAIIRKGMNPAIDSYSTFFLRYTYIYKDVYIVYSIAYNILYCV